MPDVVPAHKTMTLGEGALCGLTRWIAPAKNAGKKAAQADKSTCLMFLRFATRPDVADNLRAHYFRGRKRIGA
jgi:hypothetical protein